MIYSEKIKEIIKTELERDFEEGRIRINKTGLLKPYSRLQHILEHIFWKIDQIKIKNN